MRQRFPHSTKATLAAVLAHKRREDAKPAPQPIPARLKADFARQEAEARRKARTTPPVPPAGPPDPTRDIPRRTLPSEGPEQ
jgi:hypothetical protein